MLVWWYRIILLLFTVLLFLIYDATGGLVVVESAVVTAAKVIGYPSSISSKRCCKNRSSSRQRRNVVFIDKHLVCKATTETGRTISIIRNPTTTRTVPKVLLELVGGSQQQHLDERPRADDATASTTGSTTTTTAIPNITQQYESSSSSSSASSADDDIVPHPPPVPSQWEPQLPTGYQRARSVSILWHIPLAIALVSFYTFPTISWIFHAIAQWASSNTWFPHTSEGVNLQTNVVTQVVNGPVITSISVLFASLVSLTISNLHSRQVDTHKSLVVEVHYLRELLTLLESPPAAASIHPDHLAEAMRLAKQHREVLFSTRYSTYRERKTNVHSYIESVLPLLLQWSNEQELWREMSRYEQQQQQQHRHHRHRHRRGSNDSSAGDLFSCPDTAHLIVSQIQQIVHRIMYERGKRWTALQTAPFPKVHYLTLTLLALSIVVSFLVATAQAEFIFLRGMPVRVLWSVLLTSFTALGCVCFDLAKPFGGAYHVL